MDALFGVDSTEMVATSTAIKSVKTQAGSVKSLSLPSGCSISNSLDVNWKVLLGISTAYLTHIEFVMGKIKIELIG